MARLIVWSRARPDSGDARKEAGRYQRGMLVSCLEDGQALGRDIERGYPLGHQATAPWWRVIDVPSAAVSDFNHLLSPQLPRDGILPRKRLNKIDLDQIETAAAAKIGRDLQHGETLELTKAKTLDSVLVLADVLDPEQVI